MKVLMVDDDPTSHTAIADILIHRGCRLLEVGGSEEALTIAHKEKPEIAIVDLLTPKLDRREFVRRLRHDSVIARMPVIFYTDGYLEIASALGRDAETLLTPMLLCEEAIRGQTLAEPSDFVTARNRKNKIAPGLGQTIQELFTFACVPDGERSLIHSGELINEIVEHARQTFSPSIEITSACSDDLWVIEGDRLQLLRVLTSLFINARDAMPQGGTLLVWAHNFNVDQRYASMTLGAKLGRYVMLRVSDTGGGTPRPVIDDVFNSFLESKQVGPGTSLGLVRSHGGFMSVYSEFGRGTTFQIFLPAADLEEPRGKHKPVERPEKRTAASAAVTSKRLSVGKVERNKITRETK